MSHTVRDVRFERKFLATDTGLKEGRDALVAVESEWCSAASTWDVEALVAIYTEDAMLFGGRPGLAVGHPAIRTYFSSYVGILNSTRLQLYDQNLMRLGSDMFIAQGHGVFTFHFSDGRTTAPVSRTTLLLTLEKKRWKVRVHHFSPEV